jgi:hypothetical protein
LKNVLKILREHQFYAKLSRCSFYQRKIHYLVHIISEGIHVDPLATKSIDKCPAPRNVAEVRSFMVLVGSYIRFIEGFSKIVHSITSMQKKGERFGWTLDCEMSFQHLKILLSSASILRIADPYEDVMVCTNACKGLGGVLSQNEHVICYESRKLKEHQRLYANHDLELEAIVHALKILRH